MVDAMNAERDLLQAREQRLADHDTHCVCFVDLQEMTKERDAMHEVVEAARGLCDCYHGMHGMECQHSVAVTDALARLDDASGEGK